MPLVNFSVNCHWSAVRKTWLPCSLNSMTSLDLLLLFLVKSGINTPYAWSARAGISLGASLPALKRLLRQELVKENKPGPRGRREFALTRAGSRELAAMDRYLQQALVDPVTDMDSTLRLTVCAMATGSNKLAVGLLNKAAEHYQSRLANLQKSRIKKNDDLSILYRTMTAHCEAEKLQANSSSLRTLASQIAKLGAGPRRGKSR